MSPSGATRNRRHGEEGGYCRKWTTAAWRKQRVKDLRTAQLQVKQRQDEKKRAATLLPLLSEHRKRDGDKKKLKWETNDHSAYTVFLPLLVPLLVLL